MTILHEERVSDSAYVESVTRGYTASAGETIRPAESHWHMVLSRVLGRTRLLVVGPWMTAGELSYGAGADLLWIKFKLGVFMPHLPVSRILERETPLPEAGSNSFWLKSSAWQFPDFENADTFIDRLARQEVLARDPLVSAALQGQVRDTSPRTLRHRFLQATGLAQGHIHQIQRAQQAAALLQQGTSILDAVFELGYYDQPHLTRSLKRWVGHTPAQVARMGGPT